MPITPAMACAAAGGTALPIRSRHALSASRRAPAAPPGPVPVHKGSLQKRDHPRDGNSIRGMEPSNGRFPPPSRFGSIAKERASPVWKSATVHLARAASTADGIRIVLTCSGVQPARSGRTLSPGSFR